jgi:Uma2 family endonuclease
MIAEPPIRSATMSPVSVAEFERRYGHRTGVELVRGQVTETPMPNAFHGRVSFLFAVMIELILRDHDLGIVTVNDTLVRIPGDPPGLRGGDVCYYSYARLPKGRIENRILDVVPELVVEVLSPSQSLADMDDKIDDYFSADVRIVVVIDPDRSRATIHRTDGSVVSVPRDGTMIFPELLPGLSISLTSVLPNTIP